MLKKFLLIISCTPLTNLNAFWGSTQATPAPTQIIQKVSLPRQEQVLLYSTAAGVVILSLISLGQSIKVYLQNRKFNTRFNQYDTQIQEWKTLIQKQGTQLYTNKLALESQIKETDAKITALSTVFYGAFRKELKEIIEKIKLEVKEQTTAPLTQYVTQKQLQDALESLKKPEDESAAAPSFFTPEEASSSALTMSALDSGTGAGTGALVTSPER